MCESNLDARKKTRRLVGLPVFSHYGSLHRCLAFIQNPASLTPWSSPNPLPPLAASVPATTASSSHARSQICQTNPTPTCSRRSWAARYSPLFSHHLQRTFKLCHHCTTCCCSHPSRRGKLLPCWQRLQRPCRRSQCPFLTWGALAATEFAVMCVRYSDLCVCGTRVHF